MDRNDRRETRELLQEARRRQMNPPLHKVGKSLLRWLRELLRKR